MSITARFCLMDPTGRHMTIKMPGQPRSARIILNEYGVDGPQIPGQRPAVLLEGVAQQAADQLRHEQLHRGLRPHHGGRIRPPSQPIAAHVRDAVGLQAILATLQSRKPGLSPVTVLSW